MGEDEVVLVKKTTRRPQNLRKRATEEGDTNEADAAVKIEIKTRRTEEPDGEEKPPSSTQTGDLGKLDIFYQATASKELQSKKISPDAAEYTTPLDRDHRAQREAKIEASRTKVTAADLADESYKGQSGYRSYIEIRDTAKANATSDKNRAAGPVRATAHIRSTCRFDYAIDLCKDYNETGFCGFGDSCKFVHDRGDYKSGWELEQEWEAQRYVKADEDQFLIKEKPVVRIVEPAGPPETCFICDKPYTKPIVVTKCKHFFCEACAIAAARKSPKCPQCSTLINGQFQIHKPPNK